MNSAGKIETNGVPPLLAGLLFAFGAMAVSTTFASLLLLMPSQNESSLTTYAYIIHGFSLLVGGAVAGRRSGAKGWYSGGMTGLLYGLIIQVVAFLGFDQGISLQTLAFFAGAFLIAAFGGMIGVNTRK